MLLLLKHFNRTDCRILTDGCLKRNCQGSVRNCSCSGPHNTYIATTRRRVNVEVRQECVPLNRDVEYTATSNKTATVDLSEIQVHRIRTVGYVGERVIPIASVVVLVLIQPRVPRAGCNGCRCGVDIPEVVAKISLPDFAARVGECCATRIHSQSEIAGDQAEAFGQYASRSHSNQLTSVLIA